MRLQAPILLHLPPLATILSRSSSPHRSQPPHWDPTLEAAHLAPLETALLGVNGPLFPGPQVHKHRQGHETNITGNRRQI